MAQINVTQNGAGGYAVYSVGMEEQSSYAHWGPGVRPFLILHFVFRGSGYWCGRKIECGQGFAIFPDQLHEYHPDAEDPWNYCYVIVNCSGTEAESLLRSYGVTRKKPVFRFSFRHNFADAMRMMVYARETVTSPDFADGMLMMLLSFIKQDTPQDEAGKGITYVRAAQEYIECNYHRRLQITEVAKNLYIDAGYLYTLFMKHTGTSPKEYLNDLRIRRACELLTYTKLQITEVAQSVGYGDPLQFSRFFHRRVGMSPSEYRQGKLPSSDVEP